MKYISISAFLLLTTLVCFAAPFWQNSATTNSYPVVASTNITAQGNNLTLGALGANVSGANNTSVGASAQTGTGSILSGSQNSAYGQLSQNTLSSGNNNDAYGYAAEQILSIGSENDAFGEGALANLINGSFDIAIGYQSGSQLNGGTNDIEIGNIGVFDESNVIRIGNSTHSQTFIAGQISANGGGLTNLPSVQLTGASLPLPDCSLFVTNYDSSYPYHNNAAWAEFAPQGFGNGTSFSLWTNNANFTIYSGWPTNPSASGSFLLNGWQPFGGGSQNAEIRVKTGVTGQEAIFWSVDGHIWYRTWRADGNPTPSQWVEYISPGGGHNQYYDFHWPIYGQHVIEFQYQQNGANSGVYGLYYPATNGLFAVSKPTMNVIVVGDSITDGAANVNGEFTWVQQCQDLLEPYGINLIAQGEGGTGYSVTNALAGAQFQNAVQRITNCVINWAPQAVIYAIGINDTSNLNTTMTTVFNNATNCYGAVKKLLPNSKQLVISSWPDGQGCQVQGYQATAISNAAAVYSLPVFYPVWYTNVYPTIVTGNNVPGAGSGNAPTFIGGSNYVDRTHPTFVGANYYANCVANFILTNLISLPTNAVYTGVFNGSGSGLTGIQGVAGLTNNVILAQAAAATVATYTVPAATTNNYEIGGFVNVTAVTVDVAVMKVTFTDENNVSQTVSLTGSITATGFNPTSTQTIRAKTGTISSLVVLTTNTGSIAYDAGAFVRIIQ